MTVAPFPHNCNGLGSHKLYLCLISKSVSRASCLFSSRVLTGAIKSERLDDVVDSEVRQVPLTNQCVDDLLRLSKKSSSAEARSKARSRLVLVLCLPQCHVSNPLNECLIDLVSELWNIILKFMDALWS